ncbi:MAG: hypothetical protein GBAus27B_000470 [Mycoplasmataceae bacterium]|nr:MAG: hypothetical protein GBAus27B_000470 [Mycoplasmataceae bacterium]
MSKTAKKPKTIREAVEMIGEIYVFFEGERDLRREIKEDYNDLKNDYNNLVDIRNYSDEEVKKFLKERGWNASKKKNKDIEESIPDLTASIITDDSRLKEYILKILKRKISLLKTNSENDSKISKQIDKFLDEKKSSRRTEREEYYSNITLRIGGNLATYGTDVIEGVAGDDDSSTASEERQIEEKIVWIKEKVNEMESSGEIDIPKLAQILDVYEKIIILNRKVKEKLEKKVSNLFEESTDLEKKK